MSLQGGAVREK